MVPAGHLLTHYEHNILTLLDRWLVECISVQTVTREELNIGESFSILSIPTIRVWSGGTS